jgi:hypothetical protein
VIVKPQPLVLGPVLAWLAWRRAGWPGLVRGGLAGATVLLAGHAYFLLTGNGERIWAIYTFQLTQTEHLSFGAYNLWWPFERLLDARPDTPILPFGPGLLTYGTLASLLTLVMLALTWRAIRDADATGVLVAAGCWLAGYYLVASGVHERYALPAIAFLVAALPLATRLRGPLLLFSLCVFANLIIALPMDRRWYQGEPLWLSIVVSGATVLSVSWLWAAVLALTPGPSPNAGGGVPRRASDSSA